MSTTNCEASYVCRRVTTIAFAANHPFLFRFPVVFRIIIVREGSEGAHKVDDGWIEVGIADSPTVQSPKGPLPWIAELENALMRD